MKRSIPAAACAAALAACSAGQAQDEVSRSEAGAVDFSRTVALREAGECRFDPLTEHAFDGLMLIGEPPDGVASAPVVSLGGTQFRPRFEQSAMEGAPGGFEYRSQITLPGGSSWNGLALTGMWVEYFAPPETDSLYRRGLTFAASAEDLRAALAAQGREVPIRPDFRALDEYARFTSQTCGGAIMIEALDDGSALVCDRGC